MSAPLAAIPAGDAISCNELLEAVLATTSDGVIVLNPAGTVSYSNARARRLLGLAETGQSLEPGLVRAFGQLLEALARSSASPATTLVQGPGDRQIRLQARRMSDASAVIFASDRTRELADVRRLALAEAEYRSLFENSVYGIYRDSLDGKPIRANPALARFNGYADEQEHIAAVYARPRNWYVNPRRADDFHRILKTEGRVKDLVSEVYRHRTGEKCWITENAWYVYDANGNPMYIEGTIQDATERIRANAEIERLATCDSMTGAANRFQFLKTLEQWTACQNEPFALFSVDLDRFKEVNDTLGHAAGDFVLQTVSRRLQVIGGDGCVVARLGGDEFAMLKDMRGNPGLAGEMAAQIVAALAEPMVSDQFNLEVGVSVGVALCPLHATNSDDLLNSADLALYHVKTNGRNGYRIFDVGLKETFRRRKSIERDLRHALANEELSLFYQPIVEAGHRTVDRYEALMRWHHPERGFVSPAEFIPIAEEAGLMPQLGEWAIATACHQARAFPDGIRVSVNVSAVQLTAPNSG
jgi:diguanylate cyclase (GGDEF)-like protein/PAS domain S-box-containing protein